MSKSMSYNYYYINEHGDKVYCQNDLTHMIWDSEIDYNIPTVYIINRNSLYGYNVKCWFDLHKQSVFIINLVEFAKIPA